MRNVLVLFLLGVIILAAGWWLWSTTESASNGAATLSSPTPSTSATNRGQYVDYTTSNLNQSTGIRILFFHAPWCPQCRQLDQSITAGVIPENVTIFKVDYDTNQALRQQYGVTLQTTLVRLDDQGKLVTKYVAYEQPTLESLIANLL